MPPPRKMSLVVVLVTGHILGVFDARREFVKGSVLGY